MNKFPKKFLGAIASTVFVFIAAPAYAQSEEDYDAPLNCRTAQTDRIDVSKIDDSAALAARLRAMCEARGGMPTVETTTSAKAEAQAERMQNAQLLPGGTAPSGTPTWQSIGPTRNNWWNNGIHSTSSNGGRVRTILQDPTNPERVFVLSAGGGLWRTDNFSQNKPSWQPLTDAVYSTSGGAVAFGATPNVLYLGMGDPFGNISSVTGFMLKSVNGGNTWSPLADLTGANIVFDVKVDTSGGVDTVLVATDLGVYRSIDGGATYVRSASPLFFDGRASSLLNTSAGWLTEIEGYSTNGILRSTDKGASWSLVADLPNAGRVTLASAAPGESTVYALVATYYDNAQGDVLKSTDGGLTWTSLGVNGSMLPTNPNPYQPTMDILSGQAWYNQMILVDPSDPTRNTVYIGGQFSSAVTRNGGNTWTLTSNWLGQFGLPYVHADFHAGAFVSLKGHTAVVFGTDGGIFVSADGAKTFDDGKNEGIVSELLYALSASGKNPQFILAGAQDNGTLLRLPNQTVWNGVIGGDGFGNGWSQANDAVSLGSLYYSYILRADNNPPNARTKWSFGYTGIDGPDFYYFTTPLITPTVAADPTGLTFFTKTGLRVYRTQDGAKSWQPIGVSRFLGGNPALECVFNTNMMNTAVAPTSVDQLAVGCNGGKVAITTDGGATWVTRSIRSQFPRYAGVSSATWGNASTLYVGSIVPGRPVVKSTNGGLTWIRANNGIPNVEVSKLLADWRDASGNTVYAGTAIGVYRTTDGGAHWSRFGAQMPMVSVTDLHLSADGKLLRAATYGRGAWEIGL